MPSVRHPVALAAAAVAALVWLVYLPTLGNGFVNWDDGIYVYRGRLADALPAAFAHLHASGNWHPLTTLSHALDSALWGGWAGGHHLTSVLLHGLNAALVVLLTVALVGDQQPGSRSRRLILAGAAAGLLWGLHPLRVEAVAWVSERKEVLCTCFYLLGLLGYLRYARTPKLGWYAVALTCLALALLGKPMAVSFPFVLLILDAYPLHRSRTASVGRLLAEKLPFVLLAAAAAAVTLVAQRAGGAMGPLAGTPLSTRALVAVRASVDYLARTLWPAGLHPLYGYPAHVSLAAWPYALATAGLALLVLSCLLGARRQPAAAATLCALVATLLPVAGLIQVGPQAMADRYTYLPGIVLAILLGSACYRVAGALEQRRRIALLAGGGLAVAATLCAWLTIAQARLWHDSETLWTSVLRHEPDNAEAHNNRADFYYQRGQLTQALADYDRALAATPVLAPAHADKRRAAMLNDRAVTLAQLGRMDEAVADETQAIRLRPDRPDYYANRARMLDRIGRPEAAVDWQTARRLAAAVAAPRATTTGPDGK